MYEQAFRHIVFPALDKLNGTTITRVLRILKSTEGYSLDELRELQKDKLSKILRLTRSSSEFYRKHWSSTNRHRQAISHYQELDGLPIITKAELREARDAFPLNTFRGRWLEIRTSGSTGTPATFLRSAEQESWFWALRIRIWNWAGWRTGEPYLAVNLNSRDAWKKKLQDKLFRCCYLTYNADSQNSQDIVDCLVSGRYRHINGFGSSILALADYMNRNDIENPGVEILTSTGDNLFPTQRELIEKVFGVNVIDYYGAGGEGVHLASQCRESLNYHLHMENAIVEIIRDGRPAKAGETGSVVITQLDNYAMPLIRYDLGDLATAMDDKICDCGRAHQRIAGINGRVCDIVRAPSGDHLLPQFFFIGPFKTLERVHRYQVVQNELDRVTVKLVPEKGCDRNRCQVEIRNYLEQATQGSLKVHFDWVEEIPLSRLGKPRPVVSTLEG